MPTEMDTDLTQVIGVSSRDNIFPKELCHGRLRRFTTSNGEHQVRVARLIGRQPRVVQREEKVARLAWQLDNGTPSDPFQSPTFASDKISENDAGASQVEVAQMVD